MKVGIIVDKLIMTEMKQMMREFGEIFSIINRRELFEDENNMKECLYKCKKLQNVLMNCTKLIELTFIELQEKREQALLALSYESDNEKKLKQLDSLVLEINRKQQDK